ncbi:jhy protein homolog isoform X1 [Octopus sinensis]|uniref:Jhy protein homolog isoform X1 n=1 Tax=Octopus sinensis TaxID=2607531 RepID=A0A6P7SEC1_9MOLL|nr:jhy protein homolog isoform X1 [Octopus sinensis]
MAEPESFRLNLSDSNKFLGNNNDDNDDDDDDDDDDDIRSVCSQLNDDQDTHRTLDDSITHSQRKPDLSSGDYERKLEGNLLETHSDRSENSKSLYSRKSSNKNMATVQRGLEKIPNMYNIHREEMVELVQEQVYQRELQQRISHNENVDARFSFQNLPMKDTNDDECDDRSENRNGSYEDLYDSLEANGQYKEEEEEGNNEIKTSQSKFDDRLDQFYLKSPQKENRVLGPIKGDHEISVQKWSEEQLFNEFKKIADGYDENSVGMHHQQSPRPSLETSNNYWQLNSNNKSTKHRTYSGKENIDYLPLVRKPNGPSKPSMNYVEFNKFNYDKPIKNQSYKDLHSQRKYSSKPESFHRNSSSGRSEPALSHQEITRPLLQKKPASAEDLWRKRSTQLVHELERKLPPVGKLQKFPSDSKVNYQTTKPYHLQPLKPIPPPAAQSPRDIYGGNAPLYQTKVIDLDPISKDFLTDDGQRISVDINLKLLSPPASTRYHHADGMQTFGFPPPDNSYKVFPKMADYQNMDEVANYEKFFRSSELLKRKDIDTGEGNSGNFLNNSLHGSDERLPKTEDDTSYAGRYQKMRNADFKYKVYTVDDYRKMQKEVKLGRLGPDLDSENLKEKLEKRQRQAEYARRVHEENKTSLSSKPLAPPPCPPQSFTKEQENRRKMAIEYSKTVPKPAVKPVPLKEEKQRPVQKTSPLKDDAPVSKPSSILFKTDEIEKLREQHEQDKKAAEAIRQRLNVKS